MRNSFAKISAAIVLSFLASGPVPANALPAAKPLQEIRGILAEEFGLSNVAIDITEQDIKAQSAPGNKIEFTEAVRQAMKSFLEDGADEESPLAILQNQVWPQNDPAVLTATLKARLNAGGTVLTMLKAGDVPEYGESVRTHWVFRLKHDLSDHLNWAVVDRSGLKPAYNYGFN